MNRANRKNLAGQLLAAGMASGYLSVSQAEDSAETRVCPPCGRSEDGVEHTETGSCSACGTARVAESSLSGQSPQPALPIERKRATGRNLSAGGSGITAQRALGTQGDRDKGRSSGSCKGAERDNGDLRLELHNEGPLLPRLPAGQGCGSRAANTGARLQQIYGAGQHLVLRNRDGREVSAAIVIPFLPSTPETNGTGTEST